MGMNDNYEKGFKVVETGFEKYWDMWLLSLGSFSWSQEQVESAVQNYINQRKIERQEALKLTEEVLHQVKKNQIQFQSLVKEAVTSAMENVKIPAFNYLEELTKKVDDLHNKVNEK